ncbi:class I SAM-dependent methyltransferase [Marinobacterium stanieri]|nr:class I SAM-dependent methyltransferase [Marinobacterium stanieri]
MDDYCILAPDEMSQLSGRMMKFSAQMPQHKLAPLLAEWFDSELGQELIEHERALAEQVLPTLFGYHLLQVGYDCRQTLFETSPVSRKVMLIPAMQLGAGPFTILAEHEELPVLNNEVDVVILHHALDFATNPHQVLREAARVLRPGGHLVSFSFNPASYWGLRRLTRRRVPPMWSGHFIRLGRLHDWLSLLEMTELKTRSACHHLPLKSPKWRQRLRWFEKLSQRVPMHSGATMMVLARKDVVGMTPIKPEWRRRRILSMPVPEPKPTARG